MGEDLSNLSGEIENQLKAIRLREARASAVDPHRLAAELARIEFKPEYATDLGIIRVNLGNWSPAVHRTHNFPIIFAAGDRLIRRRRPNSQDPIEMAVFEAAPSAGYHEILRRLKMDHPALYRRMREVTENLSEQKRLEYSNLSQTEKAIRAATEEEKAEWAYIDSSTYGAAADIARSIDPDYNLELLYLTPSHRS